ncbi:unnamed protein product [Bursaphelenchus okinawaensis]|uniref:Protein kinase domain-containing protein n=1 Tax=Bursaphelenchus okinawaensis TaxID=465554 RepID=A0A811KSZ4_9BILA|nr:unnamed protein product [Bursaphelenchus okinawaensis]CAG9111496.1 unnamed protein product [Bursaphelenchus okinawaensis]
MAESHGKKKKRAASPKEPSPRPALTPKERHVDVYHEDQKVKAEPVQAPRLKLPFRPGQPIPWTPKPRKTQLETNEQKAIRDGKLRCVHMWPTEAHKHALQHRPKPWVRDPVMNILHIDFYVGRVPLWYIETKLLKVPGDFILSRAHDNTPRISVMTHERDHAVATFTIAFEQSQNKSDRNFYYKFVGTNTHSNSIWGLVLQYRENPKLLEEETRRKASLLYPVIPCQSCMYVDYEYYFAPMHIRHFADLVPGAPIRVGRDGKVLKGTRTLHQDWLSPPQTAVHNAIIKEFEEYSAEILDKIFHELHIVQIIRHTIGWDTVVNVGGVYVFKKPYSIVYTECDGGSLLDYFKQKEHSEKDKVAILLDLATTLAHIHQHRILHGDIQARNVFVDTAGPYYKYGGMHYCVRVLPKDGPVMSRIHKEFPHSPRHTAPEVATTGILNEKTEVYSFGMLMYEVMTGEKPLKHLSDDEYWKKIKEDNNMRPVIMNLSPAIKKIIDDCWSTHVEKRPKMDDVCQALYNIKEKEDTINTTQENSKEQKHTETH